MFISLGPPGLPRHEPRKGRFGKSVPNPFCGLKSPTKLCILFGAILIIIVRPLPCLRDQDSIGNSIAASQKISHWEFQSFLRNPKQISSLGKLFKCSKCSNRHSPAIKRNKTLKTKNQHECHPLRIFIKRAGTYRDVKLDEPISEQVFRSTP